MQSPWGLVYFGYYILSACYNAYNLAGIQSLFMD